MFYFFLATAIVSSVLFGTDMTLRYLEKVKSFGAEKPLIKKKGVTIPIECFLPLNITMLIVYFFIFGLSGMLLSLAGLYWYFALPCALMSGSFGVFIYQYPYNLMKKRYLNKTAPLGDIAAGAEGRTLEAIPAEDYGMIEFEWNGELFKVNAMSSNHTPLCEHERVIIILEEGGVYFVESITEVFEAINNPDDNNS